jgi:opacity protein-like surface antigen
MSRTVMSVVLATVVGSLAAGAYAQENTGFYVGAGYGAVKMPKEDGLNFSNPKNGSIDFGYSFSESFAVEAQYSASVSDGTFSADESEDITYSTRSSLVSKGYTSAQAAQAVKSATMSLTARADASVDSYGVFGVYRTSGPFYAKVKAGVVSVKATTDFIAEKASAVVVDSTNKSTTFTAAQLGIDLTDFNESNSASETKFSVGVGAGYRFSNKISVELEYTKLSSDFDAYSLSAKYAF